MRRCWIASGPVILLLQRHVLHQQRIVERYPLQMQAQRPRAW